MKKIIFAILLFTLTSFCVASVDARSGCCSWHGGVCGCGCCDGSPLSSTCAPYYPQCSTRVIKPPELIFNPLEDMQMTYLFHPNYDGETYNVEVELKDSNPTNYSATLSKCAGCNPGPLIDFYSNKFSFSNVRQGTWYLNVKKGVNGYWSSPTTYWTIEIPAWYQPPEPTSIVYPTDTPTPTTNPIQDLTKNAGGSVPILINLGAIAGLLALYLNERRGSS